MERSTIREDVFIATLAERDKEIAELKQAAKFDRHNSDDWKTMIDSNAEMEKTITELRAALNDAADYISRDLIYTGQGYHPNHKALKQNTQNTSKG